MYLCVPSVDDASNDNIARFIAHAHTRTHTRSAFYLSIGKVHFAHVKPTMRIEDAPYSGKSATVLPFGRNSVSLTGEKERKIYRERGGNEVADRARREGGRVGERKVERE